MQEMPLVQVNTPIRVDTSPLDLWGQMGYMRWPLLFSLLAVLLLSAWSASKLFRGVTRPEKHAKTWIDAILFWGAFAVITGVLGTLVGITVAAGSIEAAGAVSAPLVWGGIRIALSTTVAGVLILALASLLWFGLQLRWRFLMAAAGTAPGEELGP